MAYAKILNEKTIDRNPPRRATINGREVTGELPADYLATLGYLPFDETPVPSELPAQGKHWEPRYAESSGRVVPSWTQVDNPAPASRRWSRLSLKTAFARAGLLSQMLGYLATVEIASGYSAAEALTDCDYIEEGYGGAEAWNAILDGAAAALGKTRAEIDAFLDTIPTEE